MKPLKDKVALVTGASRGVGKGIALGLGEAGATVYITGRTVKEGTDARGLPGTIQETALGVEKLGGKGIAIQCDHRNDKEVEAVFERIAKEQKRLDILVNNVWGGHEQYHNVTDFMNRADFWNIPVKIWDDMFQAGVRAHYVASTLAAPIMIKQKSGLIVNISYVVAKMDNQGVANSTAKAADDRMATCMAHELRTHNIAVVSLYPGGLVRTEWVMRQAKDWGDLTGSESPQLTGRAVAALAADPRVMEKSGKILVVAALANEYGFKDIDGTSPQPWTIEDALKGNQP
jgi:NAD(P)-dependent dehydrogenase (short-subunit alcohol dehydrogenase family)